MDDPIPTSDEELIELALAGRETAFGELFTRHYPGVFRFLLRQTEGKVADAEDLAQLTFVRAFRGLDGLDSPGAFKGWLYRIARNAFLTWISRKADTAFIEETAADPRPSPEESLTQAASDRDAVTLFIEWLRQCAKEDRRIFFWCRIAGQEQQDVAMMMDRSRAWVAQRLCRLRLRFLEALESHKGSVTKP